MKKEEKKHLKALLVISRDHLGKGFQDVEYYAQEASRLGGVAEIRENLDDTIKLLEIGLSHLKLVERSLQGGV